MKHCNHKLIIIMKCKKKLIFGCLCSASGFPVFTTLIEANYINKKEVYKHKLIFEWFWKLGMNPVILLGHRIYFHRFKSPRMTLKRFARWAPTSASRSACSNLSRRQFMVITTSKWETSYISIDISVLNWNLYVSMYFRFSFLCLTMNKGRACAVDVWRTTEERSQ